jgi:hypothetical protein
VWRNRKGHFGAGLAFDGNRAVTLDGPRRPFRLRLAQRRWETEQYFQAMNEWRAVLVRSPASGLRART